jgi:prepilin-type N-terminal cleavage/methylation domain-containing protein
MTTTKTKNQKGFTLIEIAIVLVIIGLLLGGVLKGQELIKSAKVKAAAGDVSAFSVALYAYQDRYGDLFLRGATAANYVGNVALDGSTGANDLTKTGTDSTKMIKELADRGFISEKTSHALGGGIVLIKNGASGVGTLGTANLANNATNSFTWALCYTGLSQEDAEGLVRAIDGNIVTFPNAYRAGSARLVTNDTFASANNLNFVAGTSDTVCFDL